MSFLVAILQQLSTIYTFKLLVVLLEIFLTRQMLQYVSVQKDVITYDPILYVEQGNRSPYALKKKTFPSKWQPPFYNNKKRCLPTFLQHWLYFIYSTV